MVPDSHSHDALCCRELYDEIGERLTKEDWEKYDILEGDFMGDGAW